MASAFQVHAACRALTLMDVCIAKLEGAQVIMAHGAQIAAYRQQMSYLVGFDSPPEIKQTLWDWHYLEQEPDASLPKGEVYFYRKGQAMPVLEITSLAIPTIYQDK